MTEQYQLNIYVGKGFNINTFTDSFKNKFDFAILNMTDVWSKAVRDGYMIVFIVDTYQAVDDIIDEISRYLTTTNEVCVLTTIHKVESMLIFNQKITKHK